MMSSTTPGSPGRTRSATSAGTAAHGISPRGLPADGRSLRRRRSSRPASQPPRNSRKVAVEGTLTPADDIGRWPKPKQEPNDDGRDTYFARELRKG